MRTSRESARGNKRTDGSYKEETDKNERTGGKIRKKHGKADD